MADLKWECPVESLNIEYVPDLEELAGAVDIGRRLANGVLD
jgi:hypothetical protein